MEKICPTCKNPKDFPLEFDSKGKYCKECHSRRSKEWRLKNPDKNKASQKKYYNTHRKPSVLKEKGFKYREHFISSGVFYLRRQRLKNMLFILDYFSTHPCVDCGNTNPLVLEFDHVRGKKEFNVGMALQRKVPIEKLKAEIAKCDIRCANCHRAKTARDFRYISYKILHEDFLNSEEGVILSEK